MVIFHKNCRSKGCFPSPNEERLFAQELSSLMCLCGPEASLPMTLNVPNPGGIPITSYLRWSVNRLRGLVSRQVEVDSFWPSHPHWPSLSPDFVLAVLCPAPSSEAVRGAGDQLKSCDGRYGVSLRKSPWGTGAQTGWPGPGLRPPDALTALLREQKMFMVKKED